VPHEVLVSTEWLAEHLTDPKVRIIEVDVHTADLRRRDITPWYQFESLLTRSGVEPQTTIVIYGDNNNWFAAWAFRQLKIYRHADVRLLNGGRKKWLAEGRELTNDAPQFKPSQYPASVKIFPYGPIFPMCRRR
jgi:thiosulfate/3-mercaptopyruvate sulfurtransferase